MPPVFWIGLGIAAFIFLVGVVAGARSRTGSLSRAPRPAPTWA